MQWAAVATALLIGVYGCNKSEVKEVQDERIVKMKVEFHLKRVEITLNYLLIELMILIANLQLRIVGQIL